MTVITKSETPYFGAQALGLASGLAITAASYTARVVADGGRVVDAAHLTDTFNFIAAQGISPNNLIFGARFGIREVNGKVEKLYALNGNDLTRYNAGNRLFDLWRLDTSGTFPLITVNNQAPSGAPEAMRTQGVQPLVNPGHTSFVAAAAGVNMVNNDGQLLYPLTAYVPGAVQTRAFSIDGYNNDLGLNGFRFQTPNGNYDPTSGAGGQIRTWNAGAAYADWAAVAAFVDVANRQVTTWNNGAVVAGPTNLDFPGFAWAAGTFDFSATGMRFVMGGTVTNGVLSPQDKQKVAEAWHVSGGTSAFGLALSQRLDTLYS